MALIGKVGRRHWRSRFALLMIYGLLCVGACTTVYPLLIMVSTSLKGTSDQNDGVLLPRYYSVASLKDATGKEDGSSLLGKYLNDKYGGDLSAIASTRTGGQATPEQIAKYNQFLLSLPNDSWSCGFRTGASQVAGQLSLRYQDWLRARYSNVEAMNKAYVEENTSFLTVSPPVELLEKQNWHPNVDQKYREFLEFKATLPADFRIPVRAQHIFQEWQRTLARNQFAEVPKELIGNAKTFEELEIPPSGPWHDRFYKERLPARFTSLTTEQVWGGPMPIAAAESQWVAEHADHLKSDYSTRNYKFVLNYILLNSRVLVNTVIFCLLAVITQLTVNPLAAYALSRYPIKATSKILLFLLATMAFPSEVAMIPSFLLLKDLGLLNTFAALVLPSAASGYMIFLLKGFFDSLPKELFEAGQLDGATETTMMRRIALPLSRPVLGYLALLAFMGAYGAFLYAFLIGQDRKIWTLMVWIYQLQLTAPRSVMMAALTIAMIPTLTVFLLAQRTIMKGIVLPDTR